MPIEIQAPDGALIRFPDGTDDTTITNVMRKNFGGPQQPRQPQSMSWGEAAATGVSNIPASAARFGQSIYDAVTSPVETAKNLAKVGYGGLSKAAGAAGVPMDAQAKAAREQEFDAVTGFFKDRYGGAENIKRTLAEDPVGMAADLGTALSGGTAVASRIPGVAGAASKAARLADQAVAATGRLERPLRATGRTSAAIAGGVLNPVDGAMRATTAVGKHVVAPIIGKTTGVGRDTVRAAGRAGVQGNRAFLENMRGQAGINDSIDMAQSALGQMRRERSDAYRVGMEAVKASDTPISYGPIEKAMAEAHGRAYFRGVPIDEVAAKTLDEIQAKVGQFREIAEAGPADVSYRAAEGLDALKQAIGEIRLRTQPNTKARNVADHVYNTIKGEITRQVPEYASVMKGYSQASDRIEDLTKTFSLGERAAPDTTARKLQSVMRNNVNTNYGRRTKLMDELARHEPDLPAVLSGQAMSSEMPRGLSSVFALSGIGHGMAGAAGAAGLAPVSPALLAGFAALPFMSPRLMGEAAYGAGAAARRLESLSRKTGLSKEQLAQILFGTRAAGEMNKATNQGLLPDHSINDGLLGL